MITIVDYGVGNITSVQKAFEKLGERVVVTSDLKTIQRADVLVVPGQGACGQAMAQLQKKELIAPIKQHINAGKKFLGICLGFQILFDYSDEDGGVPCLGIFPGRVEKFKMTDLKIPHMGWNTITVSPHYKTLLPYSEDPKTHVYFVHSYYVANTDASSILTTTTYGVPFVSSVKKQAVWGTQFHPEKSGDTGLEFLKTFLCYTPETHVIRN